MKKTKIETSKLLVFWLFILSNIIIIYSLVAMWHFSDLSYLDALITNICAQIIIYAIYCVKAYHGKKQQEIMRFERDKFKLNLENEEDSDE